MKNQPLAYGIKEACRITNLGRTTIFAEIKSGRLRVRKCGRRTIVLEDDLRAWLTNLPELSKKHDGATDG